MATDESAQDEGSPPEERMIGKYSEKQLLKKSRKIMSTIESSNSIFSKEMFLRIPKLDPSELMIGNILGRGGFSNVYEVRHIELANQDQVDNNLSNGQMKELGNGVFDGHHNVLQDRNFIAKRYMRDGNPRYAIKKLSNQTRSHPERFVRGVVDLAIEVQFLSILNHQNIIKIRAVSTGDAIGSGYFLLLDCLTETLTHRLETWERYERKKSKLFAKMSDLKGKKRKERFMERLQLSYDLAIAVEYLHSLRVIYRDMKSDNIGFDVRGDVKLFDFGLAKQINEKDHVKNGLYKMSPYTGSLRFMAPEVFLRKPYNLLADVYGFGILFWQILSLDVPFNDFTVETFEESVIRNGYRPTVHEGWSRTIKDLMTMLWSAKIHKRPEMRDIVETLYTEITDCSGEMNLDASRRTEKSLEG